MRLIIHRCLPSLFFPTSGTSSSYLGHWKSTNGLVEGRYTDCFLAALPAVHSSKLQELPKSKQTSPPGYSGCHFAPGILRSLEQQPREMVHTHDRSTPANQGDTFQRDESADTGHPPAAATTMGGIASAEPLRCLDDTIGSCQSRTCRRRSGFGEPPFRKARGFHRLSGLLHMGVKAKTVYGSRPREF